jgi:transcriptional regulator with XRE-family HTH domain
MNRYEQRRKRALRHPDVAEGYREADATFALLDALDRARASLGLTQAELAEVLGRSQPAVSQFFSGTYAVSVEGVLDYLRALHLQARVQIVPAEEDEPALVVDADAVIGPR